MLKTALLATLGILGAASGASAQTVGVDFFDYEGRGFVEDSPTSAACQAKNVNFADAANLVYRFSLGPNTPTPVHDALSFIGQRSAIRVESDQGPLFSLNSPSALAAAHWDGINSRAALFTNLAGGSNLTIQAGNGGPILPGSGSVKVNGLVHNFFGITNCDVHLHAVLAVRPD